MEARPGQGSRAVPSDVFDRLAEPVLAYAERLADAKGEEMGALLRQAASLLDRFSADALRQGVMTSAVPPARLALALILDQKARANRSLDIRPWAAGAHRLLFEGREVSVATIRDFARRAAEAGHDFDAVRAFLDRCVARLEGDRRRFDRKEGTNWTGMTIVLVMSFVMAVGGWAGYVEWRFHRDLARVFSDETLKIGLDRTGDIPDLADRLDRYKGAVDRLHAEAARVPIRLAAGILGYDAGLQADAAYAAVLDRHLPQLLASALDDAFASEGDPVRLYDALRVWSILSGATDWSPSYLAGWTEARKTEDPRLAGLAPHVLRLAPPSVRPASPDAELLAQAVTFAAEAPEPDRAFLELERSDAANAIPGWLPDDAIPGMSALFVRRSGVPLSTPIPGLYTAAGWALARGSAAGQAVLRTRAEAGRLFDPPPEPLNSTPDLIMERLQDRTIEAWDGFLSDLRVAPFTDLRRAVVISGGLSAARSPIEALIREVWTQTGGDDPRRSHDMQMAVVYRFGGALEYIEEGRILEISDLFARLNVALASAGQDEAAGLEKLMTVQERTGSILVLTRAPRTIVALVEDTLAQAGSAHADQLTNPLTRAWQIEALSLCTAATADRFPFTPTGSDADPEALTRFFAPGGALDRFFKARLASYIDTSVDPWIWKPAAKFEGLNADSAAFFQRAVAVSGGFFGRGALGSDLTLAALAERGKAYVVVGGDGGPVDTSTADLALGWPGRNPAAGVEVSFESAEGKATLSHPGPWGLFHLVEPLRLRERDDGRRFLIDLRSGGARVFLELAFPAPVNPLSVRSLARGLTCPQTL